MDLIEEERQNTERGKALRILRNKYSMSIPDAAEKLGIHHLTWKKWERGINLTQDKYDLAVRAVRGEPLPMNSYEIINNRPGSSAERRRSV